MERTLVIIKPDAVQRGLIGEVILRFERQGLKIVGMRFMQIDEALARRHYAVHDGKPFFERLIRYITSAPVVAMALEGPHAIEAVRRTMGTTNPLTADSGTIRADLSVTMEFNLVHGSDGPESAAQELALFFGNGDLIEWSRVVDEWIHL
jgi:nucleoside-diphosphate kinase